MHAALVLPAAFAHMCAMLNLSFACRFFKVPKSFLSPAEGDGGSEESQACANTPMT